VCHRTVSGAPGDTKLNFAPSGILRVIALKFTGLSGVHRTVSGAPRGRDSELVGFGNSQRLVCYNSPDMSGVHRTVRCDNGATTTSAPTATCRRIKCAPACAEVRHAHAGAPDTLQCMSGAPPDIPVDPAVRSPTVRTPTAG
jgi:hypothetical protein